MFNDTYNTKAIILDRQSFREKDLRVIVFTEKFGKKEYIARGAKKPGAKISGHVEPITLASLMVASGKNLDYVATSQGDNFFADIKSDLNKVKLAGRVINLVNSLSKEGEDHGAETFCLLNDFLVFLDNNNIREIDYFLYFTLKFIKILGYAPDSEKDNIGDLKISLDLIKTLKFILENDFKKINQLFLKASEEAKLKYAVQTLLANVVGEYGIKLNK